MCYYLTKWREVSKLSMDSENRDYKYDLEPKRSFRVVKIIFKVLLIALILFIYGFFVLRNCTSQPKTRIVWSDSLTEAYEKHGDELVIYTQNPHTFIDEYEEYEEGELVRGGYQLAVFDIMYTPEVRQLQVTVRYNKAALERLKSNYDLDEIPEGEPFAYSLLFEDGTRLTEYTYSAYTTNLYHYRYLVFENVDLEAYTPTWYDATNSAVVLSDGTILAHETDEYGYHILYEYDENGYCKVYNNTFVTLDAYFIDNVNYDLKPDSSLLVVDRNLGFTEFKYKKYVNGGENELAVHENPYFVDKTPKKD